jgi:hypothetical protein
MDTSFKGKAVRIQDIDLPRIGYTIGVGEDELHAFMDVEAAGSGFDNQGRPKMLFEPHKFYAKLSGDKRALAVKQGLAYKNWGEKPYPKDSYPRLIKAMAIDEVAALESCSWGSTQILGEYANDIGFATVQEMVQAFMDSEAEHLEATVTLLKKWKVDDDLRAHRWATVAKTWNGPGYAKNKYDIKLAESFDKWSKIKDTKWAPSDAPVQPPIPPSKPTVVLTNKQVSSVMHLGSKGDFVTTLQGNLADLGYDVSTDDKGTFGSATDTAVRSFQKDAKLDKVDGWAGPDTIAAISKELEKRKAAPKIEAASKVVDANKGSGALAGFSKTEVVAAITGATGTTTAVKEGIDTAKDTASSFMDLISTVGPWVLLAVVLACGAGYIIYERRNRRVEAVKADKVL